MTLKVHIENPRASGADVSYCGIHVPHRMASEQLYELNLCRTCRRRHERAAYDEAERARRAKQLDDAIRRHGSRE